MFVCGGSDHPAARRSVDEPELHKIRFVNVLYCYCLFAYHCGERIESHGAAAERTYHRFEHISVRVVKPYLVDVEFEKCTLRYRFCYRSVAHYLRKISHSFQQPVRYSRRSRVCPQTA